MRKLIAVLLATAIAAAIAVPALASPPTKKVKVGAGDGFAFSPKKLTIKHGTKVIWTWANTGIPHNVTYKKNGRVVFKSKTMPSGTYSHVFTKKGTYTLVCTIHIALGMKMTIKVT